MLFLLGFVVWRAEGGWGVRKGGGDFVVLLLCVIMHFLVFLCELIFFHSYDEVGEYIYRRSKRHWSRACVYWCLEYLEKKSTTEMTASFQKQRPKDTRG